MNEWQAYRQLKHRLDAAVWTGGTAPVFGRVVISPKPAIEFIGRARLPLAVIRPGAGAADPESEDEPGFWSIDTTITVVVAVAGDDVGERAMIGANRPSETTSPGMGLLEVQERLFAEIKLANGLEGFTIQTRSTGIVDAALVEDVGYIATRDYTFLMQVGADRFYEPPPKFASVSTPGGVTLSWVRPAARFDYFEMVLRRLSGSTAPATTTDGTGVNIDPTDDAVTDLPGTGTWSYSLFSAYDDRSSTPTSTNNTSDPKSLTVTVA